MVCTPEIEAREDMKIAKSDPSGAGAGSLRFMTAHILQSADSETRLLHEALTSFCSEFVRGKIQQDQCDIFCAAQVITLAKKSSPKSTYDRSKL